MTDERENFDVMNENVIEFLRDSKTASVTFSQRKYISKIKTLAEKFPEECQILVENPDGSIFAHIPTKWIKISRIVQNLSDEQRKATADRLQGIRLSKNTKEV